MNHLRLAAFLTAAAICLSGCAGKKPAAQKAKGGAAAEVTPAKLDAPGSPVFPYSVVPGGTRTPESARKAVATDKVVAAHYHEVKLGKLETQVLPAPKTAYVSYRVGDKVFWTSKPVTLKAGETILSDGDLMIRGRCGNLVSTSPREPVAPPGVEPREAVLDMPVPAEFLTAGLPEVPAPQDLPSKFAPPPAGAPREVALSNLPSVTPLEANAAQNGPRGFGAPMIGVAGGAAAGAIAGGIVAGGDSSPPLALAPRQPPPSGLPSGPSGPLVLDELLPSPPLPPGTPGPPPVPPPAVFTPPPTPPPGLPPGFPPGDPPPGTPPGPPPPPYHPPSGPPPPPGTPPPSYPPPSGPPPSGPPPASPPPPGPPPGLPPPPPDYPPPFDPPSEVPEPAGWVTLGVGLLALGAHVKRKKS